jgi:proteasome alpha subunit
MESLNSYYDEDSTIFSPDGRLFQVEYARETVKKATTTLGLKYKSGVLLISYKEGLSNLVEINSADKILKIDDNICCAYIGLTADARHLINFAQEEVAINQYWYGENLTVKTLVRSVCDYKHLFTTYYGLRPFGVVLLLAGIDPTGIHLYSTDPSGAYIEYKAVCEGKNSNVIDNYFIKNYKENLAFNNAVKLGLDALKISHKKKLHPDNIEIGIIEKDKIFFKLSKDEIKKLK